MVAFLVFLVGFSIGLFVGIIFHELGHLFLGLLGGMEVDFLSILGLRLSFLPEGIHLQWMGWGEIRRGVLGQTAMRLGRRSQPRSLVWHYLGGILSNLLVMVLAFFVLFTDTTKGSLSRFFLLGLIANNLFLVIQNLRVHPGTHFYSDGDLVRLLRKDTEREALFLCMQAEEKLSRGTRPRDLDFPGILGEDALTQLLSAMICFLQQTDRGRRQGLAAIVDRLRPYENPLYNVNSEERLAYCMIYDGWIEPQEMRMQQNRAYNHGQILQSSSAMGQLAELFYDYYRRDRRVVPVIGVEECEAKAERVKEQLLQEEGSGLADWAYELLERRRRGSYDARGEKTLSGGEGTD